MISLVKNGDPYLYLIDLKSNAYELVYNGTYKDFMQGGIYIKSYEDNIFNITFEYTEGGETPSTVIPYTFNINTMKLTQTN